MSKTPPVALSAEDEPEKADGEPIPEGQVGAKEKTLRGKYDLSRLEQQNPRLVALVAWLLTIPGMDFNTAATESGMAWRTVAAIHAKYSSKLGEFRHRAATQISLVIEAATPGLLKRAAAGKLNAFELKQLVDAWGILAAQATVRSEHTININVTNAEAELMKMIDGPSVNSHPLLYQTGLVGNQVHEAVVMGSESQKVHALPLEAEAIPEHKDIRENEVSPPNIEREL